MQRNARYLKVLSGDPVLVQKERKNKLTTRFEPSLYTVVNKHGNSLIVQSSGGAQYSHNTSHVKKLLENGDTHDDMPSISEVSMTGEPNKQDKLTPQQSVVIPEPNVISLSTTQEVPQTQTGPKLSQRLLYLNFRDTEISETLLTLFMFMFPGPITILFLLLLNVIVFHLNGEGRCVLGPRLPLSRALESLTIGLRTTSCLVGIKPSFKVESVVILCYLLARSVSTAGYNGNEAHLKNYYVPFFPSLTLSLYSFRSLRPGSNVYQAPNQMI